MTTGGNSSIFGFTANGGVASGDASTAGVSGSIAVRYATGTYTATGGTITTDGGDTVHTFAPGTFSFVVSAVAVGYTGSAAFNGAGTFAASPAASRVSSAAFAGVGTFAASGLVTRFASAAFSGASIFAANGVVTQGGAASFTGAGSFAANGDIAGSASGAAAFTGAGAFSASGFVAQAGFLWFAGAGGFVASPSLGTIGSAAFAATSLFTANGTIVAAGQITGSASFAGTGLFAASPVVLWRGQAAYVGIGGFVASSVSNAPRRATATRPNYSGSLTRLANRNTLRRPAAASRSY